MTDINQNTFFKHDMKRLEVTEIHFNPAIIALT